MKTLREKSKFTFLVALAVLGMVLNSSILAGENALHKKNYNVKMGEKFLAQMSSADIILSSWDKEEVSIIVEGKEKISDYFKFNFGYENGVVSVKTEKKSDFSLFSFSKDFKIIVKVPSKFVLNLKTSGGDISVKNVEGKKEISTSGGDILVENFNGELNAQTSGGDIAVTKYSGKSVLNTSGGDIVVTAHKNELEAKTSGGDIQIEATEGKILAETSGGDIILNYNGQNSGIELGTSGGDISIVLSSNFAADVLLKTSGGSINNNFKNSKMSEFSKSKFEGKYNNGGALLTAKTSGGSILVEQK
jgi:hypothetical protein